MAQVEKQIPVRKVTFEALGEFKDAGETSDDVIQDVSTVRRKHNLRAMLGRTDREEDVLP